MSERSAMLRCARCDRPECKCHALEVEYKRTRSQEALDRWHDEADACMASTVRWRPRAIAAEAEASRMRAELRIRRCEAHPDSAEHGWGCPDCVAELRRLVPSDADRTALATAVFELKERRENYRALLARCTPATDEFVVTAYKDGIAAVETAIEAVERLRGGK